MELLKIGNIDIEVTFKEIKNLHLSVHPPHGKVTIASPEFYDLEKVKIYAATKLAWIKKERKKFLEQKRESPRKYIARESHFYFGERYLLKVNESKRNSVIINGKAMILNTVDKTNRMQNEKTVAAFYRKELRKKLMTLVAVYASQMNLEAPEFKIRKMKTKWGSCATDNQRVWFNVELAKKPVECVEYIVVHELVHLLERNHNKRFIGLMDQYMPNWRILKQQLNELPL
jgi:predicted metal-dependent hydrolase